MLVERLIGQTLERPGRLGEGCFPEAVDLHLFENGRRESVLFGWRKLRGGIKGFLELFVIAAI